MITSSYDLNIYCDGEKVSAALYQLRYDAAFQTYETNSSKYVTISYDMSNEEDFNAIAFLLRDFAWDYDKAMYTDYDTWEDIVEFMRHAPNEIENFIKNYTIEYDCEEYNVSE
jgi:hypothetical protein